MLSEQTDDIKPMGYPTKIATCCYCGSKTALKLAKGRHELSCAKCGAPLRSLKSLPVAAKPAKRAVSHQSTERRFAQKPKAVSNKKAKPRKVKKQRGWLKDFAEDVFELVEDIFD